MTLRQTLSGAGLLALTALFAATLLAGVYALTRQAISDAEHQARLQALTVVLPADRYDNDPLNDQISVIARGWLGSDEAMTVWRARRAGAPTMLAIEAIAPDGYAGSIQLLVSVDAAGHIGAVRVTRHSETPGLGDAIELRRSDWIDHFAGTSLASPPAARWKVRKDGGEFDQFAGATITPRAVVAATRRVLQLLEHHGPELYAEPAGSVLRFSDAPETPAIPSTGREP
ncbi:MAG: electron transport complex subunit RsxG [Xanthomonadaceae bacterium]|nr:electron transport complex subunit RsxG [Xanthomonadaceae bacterium]MDP2184502.1 electron transport complex subunit RsxG [Xanthomonadales bacterium]MDZ4115378.1 electron transport complex subunit RsxG [Xanthomonadaceae bacterium]MDZ4378525.1 electron transport complex subunit RsxG [Xanthomonadaceae bacterium]